MIRSMYLNLKGQLSQNVNPFQAVVTQVKVRVFDQLGF